MRCAKQLPAEAILSLPAMLKSDARWGLIDADGRLETERFHHAGEGKPR